MNNNNLKKLQLVNIRQFALIELLITIGIIAILAAMLLPVLNKAREKAHAAQCLSNLKQLNMGYVEYLDANGDMFPKYYNYTTQKMWFHKINEHVGVKLGWNNTKQISIFRCPSNRAIYGSNSTILSGGTRYSVNYAQNYHIGMKDLEFEIMKINQIRNPSGLGITGDSMIIPHSAMIPVADYRIQLTNAGTDYRSIVNGRLGLHHADGANILFADGHASFFKKNAIDPAKLFNPNPKN